MILVRFTIDNRNRLIFYGNTVGYVKDDAAVVDEMFQMFQPRPMSVQDAMDILEKLFA